ncbi:MAG: hypothetical protein ACI39U_05905 [Candidatus Cryptobacteroides sp.]
MKFRKYTKFSKAILVLCALLFAGGIVSICIVEDDATQSRLAFQTFEVALMIFLIFVPDILHRIMRVKIPALMEIIFVAFSFGCLILGDVADFYGRIPWWDSLEHGISGVLLGILGYVIINTFNSVEGNKFRYSPIFVSLWVISFALAVGAIWEIIEFVTDGIFGLNSQQFLVSSGTYDASEPLVGHEALRDTMEDLMLDFAGSLLISVIGYFDLKKQRKGIANIKLDTEDLIQEETAAEE